LNPLDAVQFLIEEPFEAARAVDRDLDVAVKLSRSQVHLEDLGNLTEFFAKLVDPSGLITGSRDLDQHDVGIPEKTVIDDRVVTLDVAVTLQPLYPLPALTGRQRNDL
jgi:hypothetical protein